MSDTKKHPHAEVIKAWADGIPCQYRADNSDSWRTLDELYEGRTPAFYKEWQYRIKPETSRYRVALLRMASDELFTITADSEEEALCLGQRKDFIKWITDWIEAEI